MTLIQFSQGHLNLLSTCPRKFQLTYLDQLGFSAPQPLANQAQQGQEFHQLMQQHGMGLDILPLLQVSPGLRKRFSAFQAHPPDLIEGIRLTEHRRMWAIEPFLLVGVFDLLILGDAQAQIVDWKSYAKPRSPQQLQRNWQTRLYPYILANTSPYKPEQIVITYWFAESSDNSHTYDFPYNSSKFERTQAELDPLLQNLAHWLSQFKFGEDFSQVTDPGICQDDTYTCPFLERCQRSLNRTAQIPLTDIDAMPECPL